MLLEKVMWHPPNVPARHLLRMIEAVAAFSRWQKR
jgi:hypothetical protein